MTDNNNDMKPMNDDMPEWDDLQEMWQEQSPDIDMAKLARNARFVWWRMRFNFITEVAACIFGLAVFATFFDINSLATMLFAAFGVGFCIVSLWGAVYIRRGAWGKPDDTALSLLKLQIARAESAIRYIRVNAYMSYGSLLMLGLGYWVIYEEHGTLLPYGEDPFLYFFHGVLIGLGITALLFPIFGRFYIRKKKALIAELEARIDELTELA